MDVITLEEMLWHYVARMNLAIENVEKQHTDLENLIMLLDDAYKSKVSDAFSEKLVVVKDDTKEVQTHFEDALYFLRRQINELEEMMMML